MLIERGGEADLGKKLAEMLSLCIGKQVSKIELTSLCVVKTILFYIS